MPLNGKQFGCGHTPKFLLAAGPQKCLLGSSPNPLDFELVTKARTNEKVVWESGCEQLLKGYRGEIAQRLMNTASVVEQQVFRNRI